MYFQRRALERLWLLESGAVTLLGSFLWECCAEAEPPAINDIVSTTLGGMAIGEVTYRLSSMLWAGGGDAGPPLGERIGAIVLSPVPSAIRTRQARASWSSGSVLPSIASARRSNCSIAAASSDLKTRTRVAAASQSGHSTEILLRGRCGSPSTRSRSASR
jgi:hypothetical protein